MISQRGKASTKASNNNRQVSKSQTNANKQSKRNNKRRTRFSLNVKDLNLSTSLIDRNSAPAAYSQSMSSNNARISRSGLNSTRIVHREQIDSISGFTNFTIESLFSINPGLSNSFPWLAQQAGSWEKYRFNSLKYHYLPRTSTTTSGSVMLTPDYDSADINPISSVEASNNLGAIEDAPWKAITLTLASDQLSQTRYVRTAPLAANLDIKTYDVGKVYTVTEGATADSQQWGRLWVEYDVTLSVPSTKHQVATTTYTFSKNNATGTNICGTNTYIVGALTIVNAGLSFTVTGLSPGQKYKIDYTLLGTGISAVTCNFTNGTGYLSWPSLINSAATAMSGGILVSATASTMQVTFANTATTINTSFISFGYVDSYIEP